MRAKRIIVGLFALGAIWLAGFTAAHAQQAQGISQHVAVCNVKFPTQCAQPDVNGNLPVTGSSAGNPSVGTNGAAIPTSSTQIGIKDGSGNLQPASATNPVPENIAQINGAAPSLTNPIFIANAEAADVTGTFTNATQTTSITNSSADGYATGLISINGTYGTASGVFEVSDDAGVTFYPVQCLRSDGSTSETGYTSLTNTNRQWVCPVQGNDSIRVRSTAVASGTVNARVGVSAASPSTPDHALCVDTVGALCAPQAGTANRTVTRTNLTANTSTTICPTATNPVSTEMFFTTANVGIGLNGQTLTSAVVASSGSPDIVIGTAGTLYTAPVGISNVVTAYGAAGYVVCIQTLRQ